MHADAIWSIIYSAITHNTVESKAPVLIPRTVQTEFSQKKNHWRHEVWYNLYQHFKNILPPHSSLNKDAACVSEIRWISTSSHGVTSSNLSFLVTAVRIRVLYSAHIRFTSRPHERLHSDITRYIPVTPHFTRTWSSNVDWHSDKHNP